MRAVQGDDEPHALRGGVPGGAGDSLRAFLSGVVPRVVDAAALLPAPGDVLGVPSPVSADAADAGECVLLYTDAGHLALVPEVTEFGSHLEPGHLVTWAVHEVGPWRTSVLGAVGSFEEAERNLRAALLVATEALTSLDVARWREDAADAIAGLRSGDLEPGSLPDGLDGRVARLLSQAVRLRAIVDLATADDGGAVNLWQADQRSAALRQVDRAARRALSAATFLPR